MHTQTALHTAAEEEQVNLLAEVVLPFSSSWVTWFRYKSFCALVVCPVQPGYWSNPPSHART